MSIIEPGEEVPVDGPAMEQDSTGCFLPVNEPAVYEYADWQDPNAASYVEVL